MNLKISLAVLGAVAIALGVMFVTQRQANSNLAAEFAALKAASARVEALEAENAELSNRLAKASAPKEQLPSEQLSELMKLRSQVGSLKETANEAVAEAAAKADPPSVMSGLAKNPEMVKMIRDQQKMGLGMVYKGLAGRANLSKETAESLNELLADHVMTNINHLTELLREGKSTTEMDRIFTAQEAETERQVEALLGPEAYQEYKKYNKDLASYLTAEQFKGMMLQGEKEQKDAKGKQMFELMQEETKRALAAAGLPEDYQTVPTLNFRNIASEEFGERNLQLLDSIYENVANRAGSFLAPEEVEKFGEFRKIAINNNRLALTMNRKLMAPPNK